MTFQEFKILIIQVTGLDKDALHIYVGTSVYLLCLLMTRPIFKNQSARLGFALFMAISFALLGEYLDSGGNLGQVTKVQLRAGIHDIINTSMLPLMLFALHKWTPIFDLKS